MSTMFALIEDAQKYYDRSDYPKCLHTLRKVEDMFVNSNEFQHNINKLMALRLMAQTFEKMNKCQNAIKCLDRINSCVNIQRLKTQAGNHHNQQLFYSQVHKVYTAYGILYLNQSDLVVQKQDNQQKADIIKKCRDNFKSAIMMTRSRFMTYARKPEKIEKQWYQHYTSDLINLINVYVLEGEAFDDQNCFLKGLNIIKKIQRFYQVHKARLSSKNLYKSYYYKGSILRRSGKYEQAKICLLKDEKYCIQHNQPQLLEANWRELLSVFILMGDYENALKRTKQQEIKIRIKEIQQTEKNLRNTIFKFKSNHKFDFDQYIKIIEFVEQLQVERPLFNELTNLSQYALQKYNTTLKKEQIFEIRFTLAEAYFKVKLYQDSINLVNKLFPTESDQKQIIRLMVLKLELHAKINPKEIKKFEELYYRALDFARKLKDDEKMQQIKRIYKKTRQKHQRAKRQVDNDLSDDEKYMINSFLQVPKQVQKTRTLDLYTQQQMQKFQQDNYSKVCHQHGVQINTLLKDKIKKQKSLVLKSFFQLQAEHIIAILKSVQVPKSIDLQNHIVDVDFWHALIKQIDGRRLNLDKLEQLCVYPHLENQIPLQKFISRCQNLKVLKFNSVYLKSIIKNISYLKLQILVMNTVNLNDMLISCIPFSEMLVLRELDLRNNQLTARCFTILNQIPKKLFKINLSSNPLHTSHQDPLSVSTQNLILKNIRFTKQLSQVFLTSLYFCNSLTLSQSTSIQNLIYLVNERYQHERIAVCLERIKLNEVCFQDHMLLEINSFFLMCQKTLKKIQMKFIEQSQEFMTKLLKFINQRYSSETILDYRGSKYNGLEDNFYRIKFWG